MVLGIAMRLFYIVFFLLAPTRIFAYLDPGTGSLLLYAIVGVAASIVFTLKNLWYRVQELFFARKAGTASAMSVPDILLHSEGGRYWQVFAPIAEALEARAVPFAYVTPDPLDPAIEWANGKRYASVIRPGNEMLTISWMNRVRSKLVVSTTPNLDVFMWKRSKNAGKYVHVFHSPTTVEFYEKYALCYYDDIITVGHFQERAILELDGKRGLPRKELFCAGLSYYDVMVEELKSAEGARVSDADAVPCVLYAPSWGSRSSLSSRGREIIETLLESKYRVIFRPHPQSAISDVDALASIYERFSGAAQFSVDGNRSGIQSMREADLMITDFSGILFDFAFLFNKPILLAESSVSVGGYEAEDLDGPLWDVESARTLSRPVPERVAELPSIIESCLSDPLVSDGIASFRKENITNFGTAGPAIADRLITLLGACR